ncbi:hypothetical protein EYF80_020224 [Liparis tanakae]|uniref:Uncharacterized protein n=1 Tax=Liparis tanakae TaxID=230148 RepID=A0A4Z2HUS4_9TELE|nr:hypothetical protein EYF80_020224 [Liparis tanakae]
MVYRGVPFMDSYQREPVRYACDGGSWTVHSDNAIVSYRNPIGDNFRSLRFSQGKLRQCASP